MQKYRMMPPLDIASQTRTVNGRSYSAAPGTVVDVPVDDGRMLEANGWTRIALVGASSERPTNTQPQSGLPEALANGLRFFDTTLGKLIQFDGASWRDPATGNSV